MMPLFSAPIGEMQSVKFIRGSDDTRADIERLGVVIGAGVSVVAACGKSVIVAVEDVRIALSKEAAERIMV